jgi:hypothetical protein
LQGKAHPKDAGERLAFADFCQQLFCQQYAAAARFYQECFAADPKLADDRNSHRYNAACAAALAGCGQGKDAADLAGQERTRLRRQALSWLRAELTAWNEVLKKDPDRVRPVLARTMQHWLKDSDFAGVRAPDALAKLPEAERSAWHNLWAAVADTLAAAQPKVALPKGPDLKSPPPREKESPAKE